MLQPLRRSRLNVYVAIWRAIITSESDKPLIRFLASLASTGNTFSADGQGAAKVAFSVPESELANAVKILLLRDTAFQVDITPLNIQTEPTKERRRPGRPIG